MPVEQQTAAPSAEPVTLAEACQSLDIDVGEQDAHIEALIGRARELLEQTYAIQFVSATWKQYCDAFPESGTNIELLRYPVTSVTSIAYVDVDGTTQTWSASDYQVNAVSIPGYIQEGYGDVYPSTRPGIVNAVTITYVAGYASASVVPKALKGAILSLVHQLYTFRGPQLAGTIVADLAFGVRELIEPYIVRRFAA